MSCINGHLEVAKSLLKVKPDINIYAFNECVFRISCGNGHLEVAKWLFKIMPKIDISSFNEYAFKNAFKNGHLEVVKWLLQQNPQHYYIFANDNSIKLEKIYSKKNKIAKI